MDAENIQVCFADVLWVAFSIPWGSLSLVKYPVFLFHIFYEILLGKYIQGVTEKSTFILTTFLNKFLEICKIELPFVPLYFDVPFTLNAIL
jgi:hypothetical protein